MEGNDMDTYADDLSELIEKLEPERCVLLGFSAGGVKEARYMASWTNDWKGRLISASRR